MRRRTSLTLLTLVCTSFSLVTTAHAQSTYTVGKQLSTEQIKTLGTLPTVDINGQKYQVLQTGQNTSGIAFTMLLNNQRTVGQTFHEVIIPEQPTEQVRQQLAAVTSQAQAVKYYDQTQITLMRFATLDQAIKALAKARTAMPAAEIGIPITFSLPSTQ